jgi:hypothetical protein
VIGRTQLRKSCLIWAGLVRLIAWSDKHARVPLLITRERCSSIASFLSNVTPRTLTLCWGSIALPLNWTALVSSASALLVKWIRLVLSASNVAPLCLAYRLV